MALFIYTFLPERKLIFLQAKPKAVTIQMEALSDCIPSADTVTE